MQDKICYLFFFSQFCFFLFFIRSRCIKRNNLFASTKKQIGQLIQYEVGLTLSHLANWSPFQFANFLT